MKKKTLQLQLDLTLIIRKLRALADTANVREPNNLLLSFFDVTKPILLPLKKSQLTWIQKGESERRKIKKSIWAIGYVKETQKGQNTLCWLPDTTVDFFWRDYASNEREDSTS